MFYRVVMTVQSVRSDSVTKSASVFTVTVTAICLTPVSVIQGGQVVTVISRTAHSPVKTVAKLFSMERGEKLKILTFKQFCKVFLESVKVFYLKIPEVEIILILFFTKDVITFLGTISLYSDWSVSFYNYGRAGKVAIGSKRAK